MTPKRSEPMTGSAPRKPRPAGRDKGRNKKLAPSLPGSTALWAGSFSFDCHAIRARVLQAIARNRVPGLHFAGHFLDIECREIAGDTARFAIPDGPHCRDADGTVNIGALGILADNVLAAPTRFGESPGARLGTVHLQLQFTGAPLIGDLSAQSRMLGRSEGAIMQKSLSSATFYANGKSVAHGSGEFVVLDVPPGVTLAPRPWESKRIDPPQTVPVDIGTLEPHERAILKACDAALAKASPEAAFIQHFWGGVPRRNAQGASSRVEIGPHVGNRIGHVQGGILFGLAATNACAAAPPAMMLSNASAWYISPGRGAALAVRSRVVRAGRTTALVRTEIKTATGARVLEAVTQHSARKRD
jgi:acyl-coenzyme A thioesterase PaaI-like protein